MKIIVTGAGGFIGSAIVWKLNQMGITDIICTDIEGNPEAYKNLSGKAFTGYLDREKLLDQARSNKLPESVDMVIHMGACSDTTERDSSYLFKNNFLYSKDLGEWCLRSGKRYLYASSAATYGNGELGYSDKDELAASLRPLNEYGRSKQIFDLWVLDNKLQNEFVGFKFFNVYGPNEYHKQEMRSMVNKGYHQIKETKKIKLFRSYKPEYQDGGQKRDFIYIKDALDVVWFFIQNPKARGIYNVGTGCASTWNDLAHAIFSALGLKPDIEYIDMPENIRGQYQYFTQADLAKLRAAGCTCRFTSLDESVRDYVSYLESNKYL